MIKVDVQEAEAQLSDLLAAVEDKGKPIADLRPVARNPLEKNPKLSNVKLYCDPTEPATDYEWPEDCR